VAGSVVVDVRKAVVAGLIAVIDDPKVSISYGYQGADDDRRREQIWTDRVRSTHDVAGLKSGRNFREETLDFDVVLLIAAVGRPPEDADTRALELGLQVEEFLADRKNNELGVTGLQWIRVTGMELINGFGPKGSASELRYTVRYHARLT
jgi:hypothetical protein